MLRMHHRPFKNRHLVATFLISYPLFLALSPSIGTCSSSVVAMWLGCVVILGWTTGPARTLDWIAIAITVFFSTNFLLGPTAEVVMGQLWYSIFFLGSSYLYKCLLVYNAGIDLHFWLSRINSKSFHCWYMCLLVLNTFIMKLFSAYDFGCPMWQFPPYLHLTAILIVCSYILL